MIVSFNSQKEADFFTYGHVSGHRCGNELSCREEYARLEAGDMSHLETLLGSEMGIYLSFAGFLLAQKQKYALIRDSPEAQLHFSNRKRFDAKWSYNVEANDFNGTGVDKGFMMRKAIYAVYQVDSPDELENLSEESFEEEYSNITLFGMNRDSEEMLQTILQGRAVPQIDTLMRSDEIFVNIVCGKQYGYFDSILIKSRCDLKNELIGYKNTIDADN